MAVRLAGPTLLLLFTALLASGPLLAEDAGSTPGPAPVAEPSPRGKSALDNLARLTSGVDLDASPLALPSQAEVERRLMELEALAERCELYLEQVPEADHKHPRHVELKAFVDRFVKALAGWRKELADSATLQKAYRKAVKPHGDVLGVLDDLAHSRAQATGMLDQPLRSWKAAQALASFAKVCSKRFSALRDIPKLHPWLQPRTACANAPRARELLGGHLRASAKAFVRERVQRYRAVLEGFEKAGTIDDEFLREFNDFDGMLVGWRASLDRVFGALGEPVPPTMLDHLVAMGPSFEVVLKTELKRNSMPAADHPDRIVRRAVEGFWRSFHVHGKTPKVLALRVFTPEWSIESAASFGTPVARTKLAHVLARAFGEPFCRLYILSVRQKHHARGEYKPGAQVNVEGMPKLLDCANN